MRRNRPFTQAIYANKRFMPTSFAYCIGNRKLLSSVSSTRERITTSILVTPSPLTRQSTFMWRTFATTQLNDSVTLTPKAIQKMKLLQAKHQAPIMLRATVESGGCSGLSYRLQIEERPLQADDRLFEQDGVKLVVDEISLQMMGGSTIDYVDSLIKSAFQVVTNPHAATSCGCHTSFTPKEE